MNTNQVSSSNRSFWLGKLFSLLGIFPLGIYVLWHLFHNLRSLSGEESFNQYLAESHSTPMIVPIAVLILWIPIAFHGLYGLFGMKKSKVNITKFKYFDNLRYVLQRLSGIGLLLFIPAHIYKTRIDPGFFSSALDFKHMAEGLHEPVTLTIYCLGIVGVAYHLANGVWQFSIGWGIATSQTGMRRVLLAIYVLFAVTLLMGFGALWGFIR